MPTSPREQPSANDAPARARDAVRRALLALGHSEVSVSSGLAEADPRALPPAERLLVEGAVEVRQREFAAGRIQARSALAALGVTAPVIPRGAGGQPIWPEGFTGSITHGGGVCIAVACRLGAVRGIGVDIEPAEPLEARLWSTICSAPELDELRRGSGHRSGMLVTRLFCAKEAGFKSQFPTSETFIEFDAATIVFQPGCDVFKIRIAPEAQVRLGGRTIRGAVMENAAHMVAVAVL